MLSDSLLLANTIIIEISRKGYFHSLSKLLLFLKTEWKHLTFGANLCAYILFSPFPPLYCWNLENFDMENILNIWHLKIFVKHFFFFTIIIIWTPENTKVLFTLLIILVDYFINININFNKVFALIHDGRNNQNNNNNKQPFPLQKALLHVSTYMTRRLQ